MNFEFSEEQVMLQDVVTRFVADRYDIEQRRSYRAMTNGFCPSNWETLAGLGLLTLPLPESAGGLGGHLPELMSVACELGKGLVVEPVLSSWVVLDILGHCADQQALVERIASGAHRLAWCESSDTTVDGDTISGTAAFVNEGSGADGYLIVADGSAFLVDHGAPGLKVQSFRIADGSQAVALQFVATKAQRLEITSSDLSSCLDRSRFATTAEMVGTMERMLDETFQYLKVRKQFGQPIGMFQTIQHRAARQYVNLEQCRSLLYKAAATASGTAQRNAILAANALACDTALPLAHECVQFHGGMGVTDELSVAQAHKRLMVLSRLHGSAHRTREELRRSA